MNQFIQRYKELGHLIEPKKILLKKSLRVNTLKIKEKELLARLRDKKIKLTKIPYTSHGYWVESEFSIGSTPEYLQGYYYLQEAASQIAVQVLDPEPNDLVLDMCAAPGGKTTQIAQKTANKSKIIALDISNKRLRALKNNLERMGVKNVVVYNKNALDIGDLGLQFDKILLDAPCSGNFVIDKDWFNKRDIEGIMQNAQMQKELLLRAYNVLRPGGILVYSTCSLEPEEDEEVIECILDGCNLTLEGATKFWPEITGTQGFFVAKLRKNL